MTSGCPRIELNVLSLMSITFSSVYELTFSKKELLIYKSPSPQCYSLATPWSHYSEHVSTDSFLVSVLVWDDAG